MSTNTNNEDLSDEERRKLLKPDPSDDMVIKVLRDYFVSQINDNTTNNHHVKILKQLESYDDRNYMVELGGEGRLFLCKIHNGVESLDYVKAKNQGNVSTSVIGYQYALMTKLKDHGITASEPIYPHHHQQQQQQKHDTTDASTSFICVQSLPVVSKQHSPCQLVVSVYKWVSGTTMASLPMLPLECLADAGKFLGQLDQTLDTMSAQTYSASKRYHQWDGKNTNDLRSFLSCIENIQRRNMIKNIIETFQSELIDSNFAETYFRKGINHGDYNDANILLDTKFRVSGVIDFGDSVER